MLNAARPISPSRAILRDLLILAAIGAGLWVAHWLGRIVLAVILAMFFAYVIYPRLIGRDIHLHPLVVILTVLVGVELGGIAGIFIAIPIVALVTVAARHCLAWREQDAESVTVSPAAMADTS